MNLNERTTPETDANRRKVELATGHTWLCDYTHARNIERQRDAAVDELLKLTEIIGGMTITGKDDPLAVAFNRAVNVINAIKRKP